MRRIEWNHKVELTVTEGDNMNVIVAENLTPYQLDDLIYVMNDEVLNDFMDLRLRRTIVETLATQPKHGYTDIDALKSVVLQELQPFHDVIEHKQATVKSAGFNNAFDGTIDTLNKMGVVDNDYDPEQGYRISGAKLTKVGQVLCDVLFRDQI